MDMEQVMNRFPHYQKYATGAQLRTQAMNVCHLVVGAWFVRVHPVFGLPQTFPALRYRLEPAQGVRR